MVYQTPRSINNATIAWSGSISLPSAMACWFCVNLAPSVTQPVGKPVGQWTKAVAGQGGSI